MKQMLYLATVLCIAGSGKCVTEPIYFYWTADGSQQYNAYFEFSGGSVVNGVFTPTGLISYSLGTPFGIWTPDNHGSIPLKFYTDTPYGPSFNIGSIIKPVAYTSNPFDAPYQEIEGANIGIDFGGQNEIISYYANGKTSDIQLTGTWAEQIPDAASSVGLLAVALGGLGLFHAARAKRLKA